MEDSPDHAMRSTNTAPKRSTVTSPQVVQGSRPLAAVELLVSVMMLAFFGFVLVDDPKNMAIWSLLFLALPTVWKEIRQFIWPARFEVGDGSIAFDDRRARWTSPVDNVADVRRLEGRLLVTFYDPEQVLPEELHPSLEETRQTSGVHLELSNPFTRRSIRRLSELLPSTAAGAREVDPRIVRLSRPTAVVPILVGLNCLLFAAMVLASSKIQTVLLPDLQDLMAWGAQIAPLALSTEPWLLLTSTFVHFGLIHLALNMWALLRVGGMVEHLFGRSGLLTIYLLSGVVGSLAAAVSSPGHVLCGASGAILGLFGALLTYAWRQGSTLPSALANRFKFGIVVAVALTFLLDATVEFISQAAHIGGFVAGVMLAWSLARPFGDSGLHGQRMRSVAVIASSLIVIATFHPHITSRAQENVEWVRGTLIAFERTEHRFQASVAAMSESERQGMAMSAWIEQEVLPPWREIRALVEEPSGSSRTTEAAEARQAARRWADARQLQFECALVETRPARVFRDDRCREAESQRAEADAELRRIFKLPEP